MYVERGEPDADGGAVSSRAARTRAPDDRDARTTRTRHHAASTTAAIAKSTRPTNSGAIGMTAAESNLRDEMRFATRLWLDYVSACAKSDTAARGVDEDRIGHAVRRDLRRCPNTIEKTTMVTRAAGPPTRRRAPSACSGTSDRATRGGQELAIAPDFRTSRTSEESSPSITMTGRLTSPSSGERAAVRVDAAVVPYVSRRRCGRSARGSARAGGSDARSARRAPRP